MAILSAFFAIVSISGVDAQEHLVASYEVEIRDAVTLRLRVDVIRDSADLTIEVRSASGTNVVSGEHCGTVWRLLSAGSSAERSVQRSGETIRVERTEGAVRQQLSLMLSPGEIYPFPLLIGCGLRSYPDGWIIYDPRARQGTIQPVQVDVTDERVLSVAGRSVSATELVTSAPDGTARGTYRVRTYDGLLLSWQEQVGSMSVSGEITFLDG